MFWINEKLGVALESTEAGLMTFDFKSGDFTMPITPELNAIFFKEGCKRSNADEAEDFARARLAEQAKEA
ncbi:MAG: hypothetical protein PUD60_04575 [Akkermansia muciniphila]|nr:hypothetical protein [Akkermansia muciniphila]